MNLNNILVNKKTNISNLDGIDTSQYKRLRSANKLSNIESMGRKKIDSYPYLQRDLWAALVKYQPELKRHKDSDMAIPHRVLQNLMGSPEFESMRAYTQGDPTVAAIGLCSLSKVAIPMVEQINREIKDRKKKMEDTRKKAEEKRKAMRDNRNKEDELKKQLDGLKNQLEQSPPQSPPENQPPQTEQKEQQPFQPNKQEQKEQKEQQQEQKEDPSQEEAMQAIQQAIQRAQTAAKRAETAAKKAESQAGQMEVEIQQAIEQATLSPEAIGASIEAARKETGENARLVAELFGAGKENATDSLTPDESLFALEALEYMKKDDRFKRIAQLAGNMKRIALKKQRSLSKQTTLRKGVQQGNEVEKMLPAELLQYSKPGTRKEFMRKFAEGETLQYKKTAKEKQGYGHMVVCVDVSGSMDSYMGNQRRSEWAKAVAFGLYSVASTQNRKMFVVEFENHVWAMYEVSKRDDSIQRLLRPVSRGGTSFDAALTESFNIIKEKDAYKKADIVFITDGCDSIYDIEKYKRLKKETKTAISTVQISRGESRNEELAEISDEYIVYNGEGDGFTDIFNIR